MGALAWVVRCARVDLPLVWSATLSTLVSCSVCGLRRSSTDCVRFIMTPFRYNFYGGAPTTHIEMTGYGLLAMVTGDRVGEAFPVARYIPSRD